MTAGGPPGSVDRLADEAEALLQRRLHARAAGVWFAPGRVTLIGDHTDYADGLVLPFALDVGTAVAVAPRADTLLRVVSTQEDSVVSVPVEDLRPGRPSGWSAYVAGTVWAAVRDGTDVSGLDLAIAGDVPSGAGLSSSASLECAVGAALTDLADDGRGRTAVARRAWTAENAFVGVPCGVMDQMAAMHGRDGHLVFLDTRTLRVEHVPFDPDAAGSAIMLIDTQVRHRLVDGAYAQRRASATAAAEALGVAALRDVSDVETLTRLSDPVLRRRARHVVTENQRVRDVVRTLRAGLPIEHVGRAMTASHVSLRDDYEVSVAELDVVVEAALSAGASGARMTGGGFGGSVVALVPAASQTALTDSVRAAAGDEGFPEPRVFSVRPAPGARRLR